MVYTYKECLKKFESKYNINKMVAEGSLFKQEKGIYSDEKYVSDLAIISLKYPSAILTMNSAFYYHNLTDTIPDKFYLATSRGKSQITDKRVVQIFENNDNLMLGAEASEYGGVNILMYNKERMLTELLRNKNKLPFDYYKEIVGNYRKIIHDMDIRLIQDYIDVMPKRNMIMNALEMEVL